jgi:hypothetical protein
MKEVIQESYLNSALPLPNVHLDPSPKSPLKVRSSTQRSSRQVKRVGACSRHAQAAPHFWSLPRTSSISLTAGTPVNGTRGREHYLIVSVTFPFLLSALHYIVAFFSANLIVPLAFRSTGTWKIRTTATTGPLYPLTVSAPRKSIR